MKTYSIERKQILPISLPQAWNYFSKPQNLKEITPDYMNFKILSNSAAGNMYQGQIITYNVHPLLGIPLFWMTEIAHVKEQEYFVDRQIIGPYKLWHHTHRFNAVDGGVEMTDIVHYALPLGWLGQLAHIIFVKAQLKKIFDFRYQKLKEKFNPTAAQK